MGLLKKGILNLRDLVVFSTEGLQGIDSIQKKLNNAILFKFAGTNNFGTKKEGEKGKSFVGNLKTKKSKHLISGLDREKVYGLPWEGYFVLVLDVFSLVDLECDPPLLVI